MVKKEKKNKSAMTTYQTGIDTIFTNMNAIRLCTAGYNKSMIMRMLEQDRGLTLQV